MQVAVLNKEQSFKDEDLYLKTVARVLCVLYNINLTDLESLLLGYYIKYGYSRNTDKLFLERNNVKGEITLNYLKLKLRKMGGLQLNPDNDYMDLHKPFKIKLEDLFGLKLLLKYEQ